MKLGIIIQARMSSSRLPGKVLQSILGKPMLQYLLERLEHRDAHDPVIVATSSDASDREIADFCRSHGILCHRGPLENVALRFSEAARAASLDAFVRVNGDSPLLDQRLVDKGVALFREGKWDLVSNVQKRSFPKGQSVEVIRGAPFHRAINALVDSEDREHATRYFYREEARFKILNFESGHSWSTVSLSVDTAADKAHVEAILTRMDRPHWEYDLSQIMDIHRELS